MNDRSAYPISADLLAQVASSEAEEREVRRALSAPVTDAEIARINAERLSDVESAIAAYKRAPWPYAPANHAHRHSRGCSGPCEGGAKQCATPEACERADDARPSPSAWDRVGAVVIYAVAAAAVVFALVSAGVSL